MLAVALVGCVGLYYGQLVISAQTEPAATTDKMVRIIAPELKTALIYADDAEDYYAPYSKYTFPYVGGHVHLKRHLEWIAGTNIAMYGESEFRKKDEQSPFDVRIWVGNQPRVRVALGRDLLSLDDDGFIIKAEGPDIYISGRTVWATEYAVYDFLERFAGCRFYGQGPDIWIPVEQWEPGLFNIVPRTSVVEIPQNIVVNEEPTYRNRYMRHMPAASFRSRRRDEFHHNLQAQFIPQAVKTNENLYAAWTQQHLRWFPEIAGARTPPPFNRFFDFQPCIGNPEVMDVLEQAARQAFAAGRSSYSVGMNDSANFCQCADCAALIPSKWRDELTPNQRNAMAFFVFYNRLAERLQPDFPDKRLGCLAYAALSSLPEGAIALPSMIVPYLTRDSAQLFDAHEIEEFRDTVAKWSRLAARTGIYEYAYGGGFMIPRLYNRYILPNIKARYSTGVDGFYAEDYPNWGLDGIKYWMIMKTLWNTEADPKELQAEYCSDLYGPAAQAMSAWYGDMEETWCTQEERGMISKRSNYRWLSDKRQFGIFTPDRYASAEIFLDKASSDLDKAIAAAVNEDELAAFEVIRSRIAFHREAFNASRAIATLYNLGCELETVAINTAPLDYSLALKKLDGVFRLPSLRQVYATTTDLQVPKMAAFNKTGTIDSFRSFVYHFGRNNGLTEVLHRIATEATSDALETEPADTTELRAAIANAVRRRITPEAKVKYDASLDRLAKITADTGALEIKSASTAPTTDGVIDDQEWGTPSFDGYFFEAYTIEQVPERTTIWARHADGKIYLAFRCEQPTNTIACSVREVRTDYKIPYRMVKDDAISLTMRRKGHSLRQLRFNAYGAWDDGQKDADAPTIYTIKTRITSTGWEAELEFDEETSLIRRDYAAAEAVPLPIARYTHRNDGAVAASTLVPIAPKGGIIGSGNHDTLMTFIWGPRLLYR